MTEFSNNLSNITNKNEFIEKLHFNYIKNKALDESSMEALIMSHLKMSGIYWSLTACKLMGYNLFDELGNNKKEELIEFIIKCQSEENGGFSGNINHDSHILYTLSAIQILIIENSLHRINVEKVIQYIASLQMENGSFKGDEWGEIDTRFSYCAVSSLKLLNSLNNNVINIDKAIEYILKCQNFDGGFGAIPGAESHAGQIFTCIGALSILNGLDKISKTNIDLLCFWLCERQCDSGGLNGRPEKQPDVCYSWWILSCLKILGRLKWIDNYNLSNFILKCQYKNDIINGNNSNNGDDGDGDGGGIADHPGDMPDIFHTFFGIAGLSLMGYFKNNSNNSNSFAYSNYDEIDPSFAMPVKTIKRLNIQAQVLPEDEINSSNSNNSSNNSSNTQKEK